MVGNTGTLMSMRLVRSKLRKREESSISPNSTEAHQSNFALPNRSNSPAANNDRRHPQQSIHQIFPTSTLVECNNGANSSDSNRDPEQVTFTRTSGISVTTNSWVFPPKAPAPNIYSCVMNDDAANDKNGFKGFRKQFSGRFKRLVAKKPEPPSTIPPELKPQLKTIYVY